MFAGALIILLDQIIHRDLPVTLDRHARLEPATRRRAPGHTEAVKMQISWRKCCVLYLTLEVVCPCNVFVLFLVFYFNFWNIFHGSA